MAFFGDSKNFTIKFSRQVLNIFLIIENIGCIFKEFVFKTMKSKHVLAC